MSKKDARMNELRYEYTLQCCGHTYTTPGLPNERAMYVCKHCNKEMKPAIAEVRTEEECALILKYEKRFAEPCAECGRVHGHHVVLHEDGAHFLHCGSCGEEMRELEQEELQ